MTTRETIQGGQLAPGSVAMDVAAAWPTAHPRVVAALRARGVQPADVDDIVQEVAIRALRYSRPFVSDEHFVRWCCRVAINLHIDAVRRARRLGPPVAGDTPGPHDTARDAERRIALDQLASSIAELSLEEQQLLFDTAPAGSRRETVRLAVRRHRLRARLAAMVDGLAAAVAVVRRLPRTMSTPAKLAVATLPIVVAELTVGPLLMPPGGGPADGATGPNRVVPLTLDSERVARRTPPAQPSAGARAPRPPAVVHNPATTASLPPRVHTVLEVNSAAPPVVVSHYSRPEDRITVCTLGQVQICVDRPRPALVPQPKPLP